MKCRSVQREKGLQKMKHYFIMGMLILSAFGGDMTHVTNGSDGEDTILITEFYRQLAIDVNQGDIDKIMTHFSLDNPDFFAEQKREISGILDYKDFQFTLNPGKFDATAAPIDIPVFIEINYTYVDRPFSTAYWVTHTLKKNEAGWQIMDQDTRDYAKPQHIDLNVELLTETAEITGTAAIDYIVEMAGEDSLILTLNRGIEITRLSDQDNVDLAFTRVGSVIIISFDKSLEKKQTGRLNIEFKGTFFNESKENGYCQVNIGPESCFASWVTRWYPMLACETSKCPGNLAYTVPVNMTVISSGLKTSSKISDGRKTFHFTVSRPLNFSFAAGDYVFKSQRINNVDVGAYFLGGDLRNAREYIDTVSEMIEFLTDTYGFYPYDQYAVVEIPKSLVGTMGGSSEQGMNLFPTGMLPEDSMNEFVICHEIGHSWWGNLVGGGVFISEALSQFTSTLWFEHKYGEMALRSLLKNGFITESHQYAQTYFKTIGENPEADRALGNWTPQDASYLHDLADMKGHFTYHMLRDQIGKDVFMEGLRHILVKYARKSLSIDELREEFEAVSGKDLKWFFDQWVYRTGAPEFTLTSHIKKSGARYIVTGQIEQNSEFYRAHSEIGIITGKSLEVIPLEITKQIQPFEFTVFEKPDKIIFDPYYKLFRWTPEARLLPEIKDIQLLKAVHQSDRVLVLVDELLSSHPDIPVLYQIKGEILQKTESYDEALKCFHRVIDLYENTGTGMFSPDIPRAKLNLGHTFDLMDRRDEALAIYKAIQTEPVMRPGMRHQATARIQQPYELPPTYVMTLEMLAEYAGSYAIESMAFVATVNEIGVLTVSGPHGNTHTLVPAAKDKFSSLGDESISINFTRSDTRQLSGLEVVKNGEIIMVLTKTV